jgi:hypothetical protein
MVQNQEIQRDIICTINTFVIFMIMVKHRKIRNEFINKTYSKASIWMLKISILSIIAATIKVFTEDDKTANKGKNKVNVISGTVQAMLDTSTTII